MLFLYAGSSWGQSAIIGTGTLTTNGSTLDPVERYYNYEHFQILYTAAELTAAGMPSGAVISALGFSISESAVSLANYEISMGLTTQTTVQPYITTLTTVKYPFTYAPVVQVEGSFDMITLDAGFTWDGTSNIVINTCTGSNPYVTPYGGLRYTAVTSGIIAGKRTDGTTSNCGPTTLTNTTYRPNIQFNYTGGTVCSGTPDPGNTIASSNPACAAVPFTLSLQNSTSGSGVTYQWQTSPDGNDPWTNVGTSSPSYTATQTVPTYYRCQVTCETNTGTSTPVYVTLNPFYLCYCASGATSTSDEDITMVAFGSSLNNTTPCASLTGSQGTATGTADLYSNFFNSVPPTDVTQGMVVPISVEITECAGTAYSHDVRVYVDWNQNGSLTDAGEETIIWPYASSNTHTINANINVPLGATLGNTLMRVVCKETSTNGPCLVSSYGETEDYKINVLEATFGNLEGYVTSATSKGPIEGAIVESGIFSGVTDATGYYSIPNIIAGSYTFACSAEGYISASAPVDIVVGVTSVQDFELTFSKIQVSPLLFTQSLEPEQTATQVLTISNVGGTGPLDWSAQITTPEKGRYNTTIPKTSIDQHAETFGEVTKQPENSTDAMFDIQFMIDAQTPTGSNVLGGAGSDGMYVYAAQYSGNLIYRFDLDGNLLKTFSIPGVANLRGMAYDGTYFYGGAAATTIFIMDFENEVLIGSFTSPVAVRAIAYDRDNDAFWCNNFSAPIILVSRTGAQLNSIPGTPSCYGAGYDYLTEGGPYLWLHAGTSTGGGCWLEQWNIATKSYTGVTHSVSGDIPDGIAGGLYFVENLIMGTYTIGGLSQASLDMLFGYELGTVNNAISLNEYSGVVNPGETQNVDVIFNSAGLLDPSTHLATITINHNALPDAKGSIEIPVTLNVAWLTAPAVATDPYPANGATLVPTQPVFSWTNGARTDSVRIKIVKPPLSVVYQSAYFAGNSWDAASINLKLLKQTTYNWQITSKNSKGTTAGTTWTFGTKGEGTLNGTVTDAYDNQPLSGVVITADELRSFTDTTDANGFYEFLKVPEGNYTVKAELENYITQTAPVVVLPNLTTTQNFALSLYLTPPAGLQAHVVDYFDVHLTWIGPGGFTPTWLTYSQDAISNSIGVDGPANFDVAARFLPADLALLEGGSVTKVQFWPGEAGAVCTYTIKVWEGVSPPTLIYSEVIPTASIVTDVWNEVTLATPVAIDATKELWVGYNVNTTAGFPAGCDPGPQDEGLGNMIYWSGAWTTLTGLNAALTYNWAIKAYIDAAKGASMTQPVVNNTSKIVNTGTLTSRPVFVDPPTVSITENGGTRPLTSYNIYRDGSLIGNSTGLSYDDLGLAAGDYEYTVKGVYPQGESAATLPAYVSIMPPPTLITAEQAGLEIFLEWESNQEKAARALTAIDGNTGNMANGKQMNSKANKAELLHGPTMVVENGSGRAVGDDCSNPIVIGALPYTDANTTCGRGNTYSETCLGSYDGGEDIIYQLVLTETKTIKFTMTTTDTWTGMLVTDACPPGATCIATATNSAAGGVTITQELAAGTYYIMMDTWPAPACIAAFNFTVEDYTPQPGEACELAIPAVVGLNTAPQAPYWFEFTPTENKAVTISSCLDGQVVDTDLEVYDACGGLLVAANDDLLEGCVSYEFSSAVTFNAIAGVTYKISWIDTWEPTGFDFTIELNDPCLVECPVGALAEGELCGEDLNSGCNVAVPVYTPISIGDVYCGSAWANGGSRDTDWYELTIDTPKTLTWTVTGEFPVLAFIIDGNADCAGLTILSQATAMACETAVATATVAPGKYWLWVGNQLFVGNPCGNYNNYVAELTAVDAFLPYYNVFRDGVDIANVYSTTYYDGDVVMGSEYCYTVSEVIAPTAGGETLQSNELCVPVVCPVPTNLAVSTVTTNSAILTWTAGSNELTWNLSYGPVGFDPLTGGTLLPDLAATTYELNGLDPFTGYDVYVQANCSETYISEWVGPVSFLTSCEYACDYTFILLDTYGDGWNGGLMQVRQNGLVVATLGTGFTTGATFTEYVSICDGFDFDVFWSTAGSYASEMGLQIVDPAGNTLYNVSPIGAALVGTIIYAGTGECPACPVPTSPTATNITMNSADLEWTSTGTLWNIEYGEFGFVQGEGTLISGVTNPYTLGGLDASTAYTFYVQNDCGDVQSDWVSYTFTTACPLSGLPFAEDFEGVVFPPACWNVYDIDGLGTFWSSSTTYANSPTHSAKHGYSTAATDGQDGWMVTPGLDLTTATAPQLSFWEYVAFPTWYVYRAVYISTGSADPADGDFVEFYEMGAGASAWTEWNFDLSAYAGQVVHIAFVYQGYDADDWYIDDVAVNEYVAPSQVIPMPLGWNGWSSYIDPLTDATFADVVAPVAADMTISQYFSQLYWPAYGINTMGNFSNAHGYLTKMAADKSLTLSGDYASTTVAVNAGWNIFPVISTCNVDVAELLSIDGFVIAVEIAGNGVYYPAYNINTLLELVPGKAYYVKTTAAGSFTFPACAADKGYSYNKPVRSENITNWNDVTYTGVSHTVIFSENTASLLENGDVIGAFTNGGLCAGMTIVNSTTTAMSLFADDISTGDVDGFAEGEMLNFRVMRPSTNEEFILDVTYNVQSPNFDGLFAVSGLSVIDNFTMSITGINNPSLSGLSIYPNPSTGIFNISVNGMDNNIDYVIMNAQGQQVVEGKLLNSQEIDLTSQPKGVYFIKFTGNNVLRIEKVVVK